MDKRVSPIPARALLVPENPLERFCALYNALLEDRPWWQGQTMFRYCALALTTLPGEPREIAAQLDALSEELSASTPWYKRSSVGTMLAALLLRHGDGVKDFLAEIERVGAMFREHWRFSGNTYEALAIQVLRQNSNDHRVSVAQVTRLAEIWADMKQHHPWLTQKSDWPACALLSNSSATPGQISFRTEALYKGLHERDFQRSDALQTATHVLFFHADEPSVVCNRFEKLYAAFKASGLWMGSQDYDEIALLCFAPQPPDEVLRVVQRHREAIKGLRPAPDKQSSFSLACGTALLELARGSATAGLLGDAQTLINIHMILAAQQAAAASAAAAAS